MTTRHLPVVAAALDLGTTTIKAALFDDRGRLVRSESAPAPPLGGEGLIRECDPLGYLDTSRRLVEGITKDLPPGLPLGLASQRSSFLLWDRSTGEPLTPLISWQDRRAEEWCRRRRGSLPNLEEKTGLPLSPHYAGPKLAHILAEDHRLRRKAGTGEILFGTLDTWFIWRVSSPKVHRTDLSMGSRTLMADISSGTWDDDLLGFFGVPGDILPEIGPSRGNGIPLDFGKTLHSSIADQTAAFLAVAGIFPDGVLVNLGTGGFVMTRAGTNRQRLKGYLTSPGAGIVGDEGTFLVEGTVNGIGGPSGESGAARTILPREDPSPDLFSMPDRNGVGSPYWWTEGSRFFSAPAATLSPGERERAVLEGIIFRVRQIVEGITGKETGHRAILAGGISADPFIRAGLAAALKCPLYRLPTTEATLTGVGLLASGIPFPPGDLIVVPKPKDEGRYLDAKYHRWKRWADETMGGRSVRE